MKRCLVDVNVWFALLVLQHEHRAVATDWYERCAAGEAEMCRLVQLALIRLLGSRTILGAGALPAGAAWSVIQQLLQDERVEFALEPAELDAVLPGLLRYRVPTNKLVGDAYLAAFAIASGRPLVTFDRGFTQFRGLQLQLLNK
jgi:toxin-antitoxin system PIN domain toxin